MLTRIKGAHIVDPANRRDEIGDLWIRDETIVAAPQDGAKRTKRWTRPGLLQWPAASTSIRISPART